MPTPALAAIPTTTLEVLHQTLRALKTPAKLNDLPPVAAALVRKKMDENPGLSLPQSVYVVFSDVLTLLEQEHKDHAKLLRGRFWDGLRVADMVRAEQPYAMEERTFYLQQQAAIHHFGSLLSAQEQACQSARPTPRLLARLPVPTYDRLFGVDATVDNVLRCLHDPSHHTIVSLKGIGGIGKTALADYVVRRFLAEDETLQDLVWISAKQEYLTTSGIQGMGDRAVTQIRLEHIFDELGQKLGMYEVLHLTLDQKVEKLASLLRVARHLVVIDNLETVADFQRLAPWLVRLAGPTKFLLTSRETVPSLMRVTPVTLNELDRMASLALINYIAENKGVFDCDVQRVYDLVGGNPLAMILLVSQMQVLPPTEVWHSVQLGTTEEMYRYIYWKSWRALSLPAQELLFAIQRAGDLADWDWLTMINEMPSKTLQSVLGQLIDLSLVQPQQSSQGQRAFAIHRLTSTFLRTEVLGWK